MKKYELMVIVKPNLSEAIFAKTIKEIEDKMGGKIVKKEEIGLQKLAYPIEKTLEGHYVLYYFETEPTKIIDLRRYFNISKYVLRNLILVHDKKFPFEMKTSTELKFPERKNKTYDGKFDAARASRPLTRNYKKDETKTEGEIKPKVSRPTKEESN